MTNALPNSSEASKTSRIAKLPTGVTAAAIAGLMMTGAVKEAQAATVLTDGTFDFVEVEATGANETAISTPQEVTFAIGAGTFNITLPFNSANPTINPIAYRLIAANSDQDNARFAQASGSLIVTLTLPGGVSSTKTVPFPLSVSTSVGGGETNLWDFQNFYGTVSWDNMTTLGGTATLSLSSAVATTLNNNEEITISSSVSALDIMNAPNPYGSLVLDVNQIPETSTAALTLAAAAAAAGRRRRDGKNAPTA